jgi:hypothetical protein
MFQSHVVRVDLIVPERENDQVYLSKLVREEYAGLKHFVLPYSYFTDGVWYTMTKEKKLTLDPFVIHNDYFNHKIKLSNNTPNNFFF